MIIISIMIIVTHPEIHSAETPFRTERLLPSITRGHAGPQRSGALSIVS
jgi:hypothetical protein